jgi:hypothetical protein
VAQEILEKLTLSISASTFNYSGFITEESEKQHQVARAFFKKQGAFNLALRARLIGHVHAIAEKLFVERLNDSR